MPFLLDLETPRMIGEPLADRHLDDLHRLHRDEAVMEWLAGVRSAEETRAFLDREIAMWRTRGHGLFMFYEKGRDGEDRGAFVGRAGLRTTDVGGRNSVELAYAVMPDHWRQGYASEMAEALVRLAFDDLDLEELVCFTMTTNTASRRTMEKAGFRFERELEHAGLAHAFYRLTRREWAAR